MKQILNRIAVIGILSLGLNLSVNAQTTFDPSEATVNGHYQVEANWSQLKRGWSLLVVKISGHDQQPVVSANLDVIYDMAGMPMNPPNKPVVNNGNGTYEKQVFIGMKGDWKFDLKIDNSDMSDTLNRQQRVIQ